MIKSRSVGALLRDWRERVKLSQLALASRAQVSTRHLSFVESGRSKPSRELLLRLAELLDLPLRERNRLLLAAGYAPEYLERALSDTDMQAAQATLRLVLDGFDPYPALAIDGHWNMVAANRAVAGLLVGCAPKLLQPDLNVLRLSLHPEGLAPRIVNLAAWRAHLLTRLARDSAARADPYLTALQKELRAYPASDDEVRHDPQAVVVPFKLRTPAGVLSFMSTTTVFGSPLEVNLSELAIEAFLPADTQTRDVLHAGASQKKELPTR